MFTRVAKVVQRVQTLIVARAACRSAETCAAAVSGVTRTLVHVARGSTSKKPHAQAAHVRTPDPCAITIDCEEQRDRERGRSSAFAFGSARQPHDLHRFDEPTCLTNLRRRAERAAGSFILHGANVHTHGVM